MLRDDLSSYITDFDIRRPDWPGEPAASSWTRRCFWTTKARTPLLAQGNRRGRWTRRQCANDARQPTSCSSMQFSTTGNGRTMSIGSQHWCGRLEERQWRGDIGVLMNFDGSRRCMAFIATFRVKLTDFESALVLNHRWSVRFSLRLSRASAEAAVRDLPSLTASRTSISSAPGLFLETPVR